MTHPYTPKLSPWRQGPASEQIQRIGDQSQIDAWDGFPKYYLQPHGVMYILQRSPRDWYTRFYQSLIDNPPPVPAHTIESD